MRSTHSARPDHRTPAIRKRAARASAALFAAALAAGLIVPTVADTAHAEPGASADAQRSVTWTGDGRNAGLGTVISGETCDVNGDGIDDVVASSWLWSSAERESAGALYVILGDPELVGGGLGSEYLNTGRAIRVDGPEIGFSISCLGDVNGDGIDDFGVGSDVTQRAYILFGALDFGPADLADLGSRGYIVRGDESSGHFGHRIAAIGDIDDDGRAEFVVSALDASTHGRNQNGRVWVIQGKAGANEVDLADADQFAENVLFTVDGGANLDRLTEVSNIGDFNGDGVPDILIASQWQRVGTGANAGRAFVIWGGDAGQVDLASLGDRGIVIEGPSHGRDCFGIAISSAGDMNGDGLGDLVIGAQATSALPGGAAVVFGRKDEDLTIGTNPLSSDLSVFSCSGDAAPVAGPARMVPRRLFADTGSTGP